MVSTLSMEIMYVMNYLLSGETPGAMFHIFFAAGAPNQGIIYNLSSQNYLNHEFHTLSALFYARRKMELVADKVANTERVTELDYRFDGAGPWQRLNGVACHNQNTPCFVVRYKTTSKGIQVVFGGGFTQPENQTRTTEFRIPNVGNNMTIQVTYKGPSAQVYQCLFPTGVSNQTIYAESIIPAEEKDGYPDRVNQ